MIKENPMEFIDRPRKDTDVVVQTFLTQEQIDLMLEELKNLGNLQLEAYIVTGLSTMARVNALSNIKWKQIDWDNLTINGVLEKEGYIVDLDIDEYCKDVLLKLKQEREEKGIDNEYVFISYYKGRYDKVENTTCSCVLSNALTLNAMLNTGGTSTLYLITVLGLITAPLSNLELAYVTFLA